MTLFEQEVEYQSFTPDYDLLYCWTQYIMQPEKAHSDFLTSP